MKKFYSFGGIEMAFLGAIIETLFKMVIVAAVAFGGIVLGKYLRKRHDAKNIDTQ